MPPQQTIEALREKGFTYYRIAKDTGIERQTLSNWHKGITTPRGLAGDMMVEKLNEYAKRNI